MPRADGPPLPTLDTLARAARGSAVLVDLHDFARRAALTNTNPRVHSSIIHSSVGYIVPRAARTRLGATSLRSDLLWYRRYKREGGNSGFRAWESSAGGRLHGSLEPERILAVERVGTSSDEKDDLHGRDGYPRQAWADIDLSAFSRRCAVAARLSTQASCFGSPPAASSLLLGGSSVQATRSSLLRGQRRPGPVRRRRPDGVRTKTCQL
jgi:hypothetical protein